MVLKRVPGGLALAVTVMGTIMAATTGIIGASVVMMTLLALPTMLEARLQSLNWLQERSPPRATLGILIPPSIMLVLMANLLAVSVGNLFIGAILPGLAALRALLHLHPDHQLDLAEHGAAACRMTLSGWNADQPSRLTNYFMIVGRHDRGRGRSRPIRASRRRRQLAADGLLRHFRHLDDHRSGRRRLSMFGAILKGFVPPVFLIVLVLGSIFAGWATPTEAAGVGAFGSIILALLQRHADLSRC